MLLTLHHAVVERLDLCGRNTQGTDCRQDGRLLAVVFLSGDGGGFRLGFHADLDLGAVWRDLHLPSSGDHNVRGWL